MEVEIALPRDNEQKTSNIPAAEEETAKDASEPVDENQQRAADTPPEPETDEASPESLPEETEPTIEELQSQIAELQAQLEGEHDALLRMAADLENYKRRVAKELQERTAFANERLITELLPPLDDCDHAIKALEDGSDPEAVLEGVRLIGRHLRSVLGKFGLEEIPAQGQPFDPNVHEALGSVTTDEVEEGTVTQVHRKGYSLHGRVLRPAQVLVAQAPQHESADNSQQQDK